MARHAVVVLVLLGAWAASAASAQAPYRSPSQIQADVERDMSAGDAELRRREHCDEVGAAECAREEREGAAEWERFRRAGEEAHCREVGYAACQAEHEADVRQARWDLWFPVVAVMLLITALFYVTGRRRMQGRLPSTKEDDARGDVASLDVAMPIEAARTLRGELDAIRAATPAWVDALPSIARVIADSSPNWTAICVRSWPVTTTDGAYTRWRALVEEIRARGAIEIPAPPIRTGDGYRDGPVELPSAETAPHALLSISVLSKQEIPEVTGDVRARARTLLTLFGSLGAHAVESVEIAWLPGDARETQTMRELEVRQPRLVALP